MGKSYKNISNTLDQNNKNTHLSRSPNFEILRVLAMLFIVFWHFNIHGIMHNLSGKAIFVMRLNLKGIFTKKYPEINT